MMTKPRKLLQGSLALASAVLVAACGGGSAGAPDVFPPTVQISSDAAATATGPVTYTFTFSEDVGTSFTDADVLVSDGTVGPLTRVSATQYTLLVTPPAATSGTIQVSVAAGAVSDAAGNVSTVNPTVATAFNTVAPGSSGSTGTCTGACIDFASAAVKYAPFGAMVAAGQASDPADIANKVARVVKGPGSEVWAGVTIYTVDAGQSVPAFDLSTSKVVTLRVYAPAAGIPIMLKLENAANPGVFLEKKAVTTRANAWETLSFDYASPDNGSYSAANSYDKVSVFPNFLAAEASEQAYFFDELKYSAVAGGSTGTCTGACIDFASASVKYQPFEGLISAAQASDPLDGSNKVAAFVKGPSGQPWAGATIYTVDATQSVPAFDLSGSKIVTLRVYAPAAGIPMMLKLEDASNPGVFLEKTASTTQANAWETLSFDFGSPSNGSYNSAATYNRVSLFPNFLVAETAERTYYVDELKYTAAAAPVITFASGFKSNNLTVENGEWGFYSGNFTSYANTYAGGGFTDQGVAAADSYLYLVVTTSAPTTDGYMGIYTMAPGYTAAAPNAGVTLAGQTSMKIELGWAAEWFNQGSNNQLLVRTVGAQEYSNGSGGFCRILLEALVTPTTADLTTYTITLNSMTPAQLCNGGGFTSGVSTVADALTKAIGEVHVQAVYPRVNTTVLGGTEYPTGFTRGSIVFE